MAHGDGTSKEDPVDGIENAEPAPDVRPLGGLAIRLDGRLAHAGLGASGRRMAAYLFAYPNQIHRKERLADLFWSDFNAKHGRHALNTALWRLRQLLDRSRPGSSLRLLSAGPDIVMEAEETALVDVHRFQELVRQGLAGDGAKPDEGKLHKAAAIYRGPLLDGEDDEWILVERERLHCLYVRCLDELMRLLAQSGSYEDALEYGRRILSVDPLRESVQRAVMLLYVLNGQRAEAVRQFERCRDQLLQDCDVAPMPQTEQLAAMIRSGQVFDLIDALCDGAFGHGASRYEDPLGS